MEYKIYRALINDLFDIVLDDNYDNRYKKYDEIRDSLISSGVVDCSDVDFDNDYSKLSLIDIKNK